MKKNDVVLCFLFIGLCFIASCSENKIQVPNTDKITSIVTVSENNIQKHMESLSMIGNLGASLQDGFLRASWSDEETGAMEYIRKEAEKYGLASRYDEVGNLYLRTPGIWSKIVQVGSHLDTVPKGGNYDGAAGIVAGLEAIRSVVERGTFKNGLELVVWRGEESATYGAAHKGCKMAFGKSFQGNILERTFNGKPLETAMKEQGAKPLNVRSHKPTIQQNEIDSIIAHIELHIEQAKKLETDGDDIGIVTSIRGPDRYRVEVIGEYDHSGATPMGIEYRRDANLAIAYMQVALDALAMKYIEQGNDLVQTIGIVNSDPDFNAKEKRVYNSALTKVSGYSYFLIDFRSNNKKFRTDYVEEALKTIKDIANKYKVDVAITNINASDPAESLNQAIQAKIEEASKNLKYGYQYMPSGAGHDAAVVAQQKKSDGTAVPVGMIFIPCRKGKSHSSLEFATTEQITKGANVLATTLATLAQ